MGKESCNAGDIGDKGSVPGSGIPLEQGIATHSSILAWKIPWTEKPSGIQSKGRKEELDTTERLSTHTHIAGWQA